MQIIPSRVSNSLAVFFDTHGLKLFFITIVTTITILVLIPYVFVTIHSGEAGVKYHRFTGTEMEKIYTEGLNLIWPWDIMYVYNIRVQNYIHDFEALTLGGLPITLKIAIRYNPEYTSLPKLHKLVGPDYLERIILPETEAIIRREVGRYEPIDIYTTKKGVLDRIVLDSLNNVGERYVHIDNVLIKSVELPAPIRIAIEEKLVFEQSNLAYKYRIELEEKEAERKRIEAAGIRDYNATVSQTLSNDLIRWQGVEATKQLATSNNAKTVIIGGGRDGIPVILGNVDAPTPVPARDTAQPAAQSSTAAVQTTDAVQP